MMCANCEGGLAKSMALAFDLTITAKVKALEALDRTAHHDEAELVAASIADDCRTFTASELFDLPSVPPTTDSLDSPEVPGA